MASTLAPSLSPTHKLAERASELRISAAEAEAAGDLDVATALDNDHDDLIEEIEAWDNAAIITLGNTRGYQPGKFDNSRAVEPGDMSPDCHICQRSALDALGDVRTENGRKHTVARCATGE